MKRLIALLACVASVAQADVVTIKLGTMSPTGSPWDVALKELAQKWAAMSGGKVKLRIYPGGTQGSEGEMVRKIGIGQLQAASLTNVGMHDIIPEPMVLSVPGLFNERTFRVSFPKFKDDLEARLDAAGYTLINWTEVGTAYIFCHDAYRTPQEATKGKYFAWDGDPGTIQAFKQLGFRPVILASTDIIPSLKTGMITCVAQLPAYMLTTRMFDDASNMIDYPFAFLVGATIVKKSAWEQIPAELRAKLLEVGREAGAKLGLEAQKLNGDAIAAMQKQGLKIIKVDPALWNAAAKATWPTLRGSVVPAPFFDSVKKIAEDARRQDNASAQ